MAGRDWGRYSRSEGRQVSCTSGTHDGNEAYNRYIRGRPNSRTGEVYTLLGIRALLAAVFEYSWVLEYLLAHP